MHLDRIWFVKEDGTHSWDSWGNLTVAWRVDIRGIIVNFLRCENGIRSYRGPSSCTESMHAKIVRQGVQRSATHCPIVQLREREGRGEGEGEIWGGSIMNGPNF